MLYFIAKLKFSNVDRIEVLYPEDMWMQQSRICILVILQEMPFCVQISFVLYCF